ncbi:MULTISPECIES: hypothetical protein [Glycomyces]|uniref:Uncharacterized protein n=2 Tax=Glycomyces TaxID=58113 RepID=A0A9X3PHD7_9ACTN|nr:hypothetical protein [Glycomyces lechevalierae]MDA1384020.1 hypothetical protein [Glycomyces lechevalierae]MDR7340985.1 hypothetical protein [Glycomyces lechevalierae]
MYPEPAPTEPPIAPPTAPPSPRPRPATDPVVAVAGNATMLGLGYMSMRRPVLAALALTGTGFLLWSAAVQTENPLWRYLLPAWGLVMIVHAWWLTRRVRLDRLATLGEDPARRPRFFAVTAAALVLLTVTWFRFDAWWIAHDAEAAHAAGDCEEANAALDRLDVVHRVAFGPAVLRGEEEHEACDLLLAALDASPTEAAATLETYLDHPGALWDGAGPKRAEFLFQAALLDGVPNPATIERGFTQLTDTLADHPGQADTVEATVTAFMDDLAEAPSPCTGHAVDDWLAGRTWDAEAISAPVNAAAGQVPDRLLDCAQERVETQDAAALFREFLTAYPDHERAAEAADGVLASGTYCADPVAYPAAPDAGGPGPHPMRLVGTWTAEGRGFPDSWLAATAAETALAVCVEAEVGEFQESCQYRRPDGSTFWAGFFAHRFTIEAYSLKTGELVDEYAREIGDPCPNRLDGTYNTISLYISDTTMTMASEYSDEDFRNMFTRLMD